MTPTTKPVPDAEPQEAKAKPAPKGKLLLIVEDERALSHALEMKLKNQGYQTLVVTNGQEAIKELKAGKYNMVLLDLIMPVMDGFAVLQEMKTAKINVPTIVLSNLGQDEDRAKAKELGAIDYFVKSNTPIADIVTRVNSAV
jgi:DNA-binding response OmpR family regulator